MLTEKQKFGKNIRSRFWFSFCCKINCKGGEAKIQNSEKFGGVFGEVNFCEPKNKTSEKNSQKADFLIFFFSEDRSLVNCGLSSDYEFWSALVSCGRFWSILVNSGLFWSINSGQMWSNLQQCQNKRLTFAGLVWSGGRKRFGRFECIARAQTVWAV